MNKYIRIDIYENKLVHYIRIGEYEKNCWLNPLAHLHWCLQAPAQSSLTT